MTDVDTSDPLGAHPPQARPSGCLRWLKLGCLTYAALGTAYFAGMHFGYLGPRGWDSFAAQNRTWIRQCTANLQQMQTALEAYAARHESHYPDKLERLVQGHYLSQIPTCPSHPGPAYNDYHPSPDLTNYSVSCTGTHHSYLFEIRWKEPAQSIPRLSSEGGLVTEPTR